MDKFRFLNWKVYQESRELLAFVLNIVKKLPKEYRFELGSQIIRSAFSVLLNIAEGSGKASDKELNHFFNIAHGSLYETFAGIDFFRYNKLITKEEFMKATQTIHSIGGQLGGFKKSLKS
jgi:four helix bundle protein